MYSTKNKIVVRDFGPFLGEPFFYVDLPSWEVIFSDHHLWSVFLIYQECLYFNYRLLTNGSPSLTWTSTAGAMASFDPLIPRWFLFRWLHLKGSHTPRVITPSTVPVFILVQLVLTGWDLPMSKVYYFSAKLANFHWKTLPAEKTTAWWISARAFLNMRNKIENYYFYLSLYQYFENLLSLLFLNMSIS